MLSDLAKLIVVVWLQDALVEGGERVGVDKLIADAVCDGTHHLRHPPLIRARHTTHYHRRCNERYISREWHRDILIAMLLQLRFPCCEQVAGKNTLGAMSSL